jgi:alpha-beta hydrolase superfamily lysophospholipase
LDFTGDTVRLAGQIDYPTSKRPAEGYPLIFVIQHATSTSRADFEHIAALGNDAGAAVFRWDKRGTGKSGNSADGSAEMDIVKAYQTAIVLPSINPERVIIFAQNEGSLILQELYRQILKIARPLGVVLAGNMLDESAILTINVPVHIVASKNDWNAWQTYAEAAADAHAAKYKTNASFYVATNTNRLLMYTSGNTFHKGAESSIKHWLKETCRIFA